MATTLYYGRKITASESDYAQVGADDALACVFNRATANMWVTHLYLWCGRTGASAVPIELALVATNQDGFNPDDVVGRTNQHNASTLHIDIGQGALVGGPITKDGDDDSVSAVQIWNNRRYGGAVWADAVLGVSMKQSAGLPSGTQNRNFYRRIGTFTRVPDPFGGSSSIEGHLSFYAEGFKNERPSVGTITPSGITADDAPVITVQFVDENAGHNGGTDVDDYVTACQLYVYDAETDTQMWYSGTILPDSTMQANDAVTVDYDGTTLSRGKDYYIVARVRDRFNEWSQWSARATFTPVSLGMVTTSGDPSGKIEEDTPDFDFSWTHEDGDSTTEAQVQLLNGSGGVIATSDWVNKTVADGNSGTVTWGESGFAALTKGGSYRYRVRARDETPVESEWSNQTAFTVNAVPSTPTNLSAGNAVVTQYPKLTCVATDADDTPATGHEVSVEIFKADQVTLIATRQMTLNTGNGRWEYQTVVGDHPDSYGDYYFRCYAYDGTYYSGGGGSSGGAARSQMATWEYAQGPVVAISSPTDGATIGTAALTASWALSSGGPQTHFKVTIYEALADVVVYTSDWIAGSDTSYEIPSGSYLNNTAYRLGVAVRNGSMLEGETIIDFDVSFTPPDPVTGFQSSPFRAPNDPFDTALTLSWNPSQSSEDDFDHYLITAQHGGMIRVVGREYSQTVTTITDHFLPSGVDVVYRAYEVQFLGANEMVVSEAAEHTASIDLKGMVLTEVTAPETLRFVLNVVNDRTRKRYRQETSRVPLAGPLLADGSRARPKPVTTRSRAYWHETTGTYELVNMLGTTISAEQFRADIEGADLEGFTFCQRDERGDRRFVTIPQLDVDGVRARRYTVSMTTRDEEYIEETL